MDSINDIITQQLRRHFVGRYQDLDGKSTRELLAQLGEENPQARTELVRGVVASLADAPEDSARAAHIQRVNEMDNVFWTHGVDPGIPTWDATLEGFQSRDQFPDIGAAKIAVQNWLYRRDAGLLTLIGPVGCGKTHLASAAARELFGRDEAVLFREEYSLIAELQGAIKTNSVEAMLAEFLEVPWLVIDDLGLTALGDWGKGVMDRVINARWDQSEVKRTLITTNLLPSEMSARIASRLGDVRKARTIIIKASDYRREGK